MHFSKVRNEKLSSLFLETRHKVARCYFCDARVSGLLKIGAGERKRVEGVEGRQTTQCEAARRASVV